MENDPKNTCFLVINSPTFWFDNKKLGQRAKETADIISDEISIELEKRGIDSNHLLNKIKNDKGDQVFKGDDLSRPDERVGEALMFQVPEFTAFLRKEYGGQGSDFWENFNADTHKNIREKMGAEGPKNIADRMNLLMNVVARFARKFHIKNPDKKLVSWIVSHGDGLDPYIERTLDAKEADFFPDYNAGIGIVIDANGKAKTTINGKEFNVPFAKSGFPKSAE
jgi:hypothetical protein